MCDRLAQQGWLVNKIVEQGMDSHGSVMRGKASAGPGGS